MMAQPLVEKKRKNVKGRKEENKAIVNLLPKKTIVRVKNCINQDNITYNQYLPSKNLILELWTNDEFSDFSISVCSHQHDDNASKRELIIATDWNVNFNNKIGEIESVDINSNTLQQHNWQNILEKWISYSNAIPNNKRTQILREISNGRVVVHPSFKSDNNAQKNTDEHQNQGVRKTSKIPSLKCRICNLSFTHAYTRKKHEELHNPT